MKILLLLLSGLISTYTKNEETKKYSVYAISCIAFLTLIISLFINVNILHLSFAPYEYIPWVMYWLIYSSYHHFGKQVCGKKFIWPSVLSLLILANQYGAYTFFAIECLYLWDLVVNEKRLYKNLELEYFFKFLIMIFVIFEGSFQPYVINLTMNFLFGFLIISLLIHTFLNQRIFYYLNLINIIVFSKSYVDFYLAKEIYIINSIVLIICLRCIYLGLVHVNKIDAISTKLYLLEKIKLYLRLKLFEAAEVEYFPPLQRELPVKMAKTEPRKFSNDLASSISITFATLLIFVLFFLYRLN